MQVQPERRFRQYLMGRYSEHIGDDHAQPLIIGNLQVFVHGVPVWQQEENRCWLQRCNTGGFSSDVGRAPSAHLRGQDIPLSLPLRLSQRIGKSGIAEFPEVEVVDGDTRDTVLGHLADCFFGRRRRVFGFEDIHSVDSWRALVGGARETRANPQDAPSELLSLHPGVDVRSACSAEMLDRVWIMELNWPLVLIVEQSKFVRNFHFCWASFM